MRKLLKIAILQVGIVVLLTSCSVTRHVPEGAYLLNRTKIEVAEKNRDISISQMNSYVRQHPNTRLFSLFRLPLAAYSLSGRDTTRWLNRTLSHFGEAPVL